MRKSQLARYQKDFYSRYSLHAPTIDDRILKEAAQYESSLHKYMAGSWPIIEGGRTFVDGWHLQALCEHLEAVYRGQIRNLIINVPPRTSKSTVVSVGFPSWCWANDPSLQFLYISYASKLSIRDSVKCRRILSSHWYRDRWGHKFQLCGDVNTKLRFDNTKTGYRIATSIDGTGTGEGGDIIVIDDPNNAGEAESDVIRESTNDWCDGVLSSRLNDPKTGRYIIVQQRLHMHDYTGHLLSQNLEDVVHLCLPMEYESTRKCITVPLKSTHGVPWHDPREKEGELLWPERFGEQEVKTLKKKMNSEYRVAGQLQQRPAPAAGGIIQKDWWQWWKEANPPQVEFVLQSWDTAFTDDAESCFSACTNWGVFTDNHNVSQIILLSTFKAKLQNPDLRRMMIRMANNYYDNKIERPMRDDFVLKPDMILVEAGANGTPLIQDLRRAGLIINKYDPRKATGYRRNDKIFRAKIFAHIIESGKVWVPAKPPYFDKLLPFADQFVEECAMFPHGISNDIVDSMMQAIGKLLSSNLINSPDDIQFTAPYNPQQNERFY